MHILESRRSPLHFLQEITEERWTIWYLACTVQIRTLYSRWWKQLRGSLIHTSSQCKRSLMHAVSEKQLVCQMTPFTLHILLSFIWYRKVNNPCRKTQGQFLPPSNLAKQQATLQYYTNAHFSYKLIFTRSPWYAHFWCQDIIHLINPAFPISISCEIYISV